MTTPAPSNRPSSTIPSVISDRGSRGSETTPLLRKDDSAKTVALGNGVVHRVLFTSFLVSLSFGVTQVPLIYVMGLMTCEQYYRTHEDPGPVPGRCKLREIEASTARAIALLGAGTALFGVFNLFFTGWSIKRFGIKTALYTSVLWPAVRLAVQNVGVLIGAGLGVTIVQASQIITIFGGPAGYLLALNSYTAEIVEPAERTAMLGRLQGVAFFGTSLGFLSGGLIADTFSIIAPFRATLALFLVSSIWVSLALPWLPNTISPEKLKKTTSLSAFFEPLKMFKPRKWVLKNGQVQRECGVLFLGAGAFIALLATGYIPTLLQLYATDELDFGTKENGWLICVNSMVRGLFLTFAFPFFISTGREWLDRRSGTDDKVSAEDSAIPDLPSSPQQTNPSPESSEQPIEPLKPKPSEDESFQFDLFYTRYSILVDGILTALATFATEDWQLFFVAVVLPLAAGTGSAAKGTILQMCSPEDRADALSAISLVEMVARLATIGLFGYVFSAFAALGRPSLTFLANGAVALVSFIVLMLCRFPPEGARRLRDGGEEDEGDA